MIELNSNQQNFQTVNNSSFNIIKPSDLSKNLFNAIAKDWMLITVPDIDGANPMTASWGGTGYIWKKDVAFSFIRKSRYTFELIEKSDYYSLCFLENTKENKKILGYCGSKSGRDTNKSTDCALGLEFFKAGEGNKIPFWAESNLVFICKKMFSSDIDESNFIDESLNEFYKDDDFHRLYIGEIVSVLEKSVL